MDSRFAWAVTGLLTIAAICMYTLTAVSTKTKVAQLVDTEAKVSAFIERLAGLPASSGRPNLYCDIEGISLGRNGTVSVLTMYILPFDCVYLLDVYRLQQKAFTAAAPNGSTLKAILEDPTVTKVFFDVRNDSDALFFHYGIALAGVVDLQLMELGARWGPSEGRKFVTSLAKAIMRDSKLDDMERERCREVKERGSKLFAPVKGGNFEIFNQRPLKREIVEYCALDVRVLPDLYDVYSATLQKPGKKDWRKRVAKATLDRVKESQSMSYEPEGPHKVLGPWQ